MTQTWDRSPQPGRLDRLRRADALIELRRHQGALAELAPLIAGPGDAPALCRASRALIGMDRHSEALSMANRAIAADPNDEWAYRLRSVCLIGMSRRTSDERQKLAWQHEARDSARQAVRLSPNAAICYRSAVDAELNLGDTNSAYMASQRALYLDPAAAESWNTDSRVALAQMDLPRAERHARRAVELNPMSSEAWNNLGVALQRSGRWKEAVRAYLEAARLDPTASLTRGNIARSGLLLLRMLGLLVLLPVLLVPDGVAVYMAVATLAFLLWRPGGPMRSKAEDWGIRAAIRFDRLPLGTRFGEFAFVQVGFRVVATGAIFACIVAVPHAQPLVAGVTFVVCGGLYIWAVNKGRSESKGVRTGWSPRSPSR